jgi:hypothetical protein
MFFGLAEISSTTIDDMVLIKPQSVVKSRSEDVLYFNGKRYKESEIDTLKRDQLKSILNGGENFTSNNIKVVYSFKDIKTESKNLPLKSRNSYVFDKFGDINDLVILPAGNQNYSSLVQHVYNKIFYSKDGSAPEYHAKKFVFANGHSTTDSVEAANINVNYVIDNIQSVKIALMPKLRNNKPKSIDGSNEDDGSIAEYTIPSLS